MAETLWATPSGHITGDCPSPDDATGITDSVWAGPTTNNVAWTSRWAIDDPSGALAGTQQITVRVRKTAHSTDPNVQVNLYESGALVQSLISTTAVSSEVDLSGEFDGSVITNSADVEVEVVATTGGGSPGNRASLQLDGIRFVAEVGATVEEHSSSGGAGLTLGISATARKRSRSSALLELDLAALCAAAKHAMATAPFGIDLGVSAAASGPVPAATASLGVSLGISATSRKRGHTNVMRV